MTQINGTNGTGETALHRQVNFCEIMAGLRNNSSIFHHLTNEFMTFLAELLFSKLYAINNDNFGFNSGSQDITIKPQDPSSQAVVIDFNEYLNLVCSLVKLRKIFENGNYLTTHIMKNI